MITVANTTEMMRLGERLGALLMGGECVELIGDVGAGKTTLTKGVGCGLNVEDDIQSPSFTISRVYGAHNSLELHHYDFYRLEDAGIMSYELSESILNPHAITVVEWADAVHDVLPERRLTLRISPTEDGLGRTIDVTGLEHFKHLKEAF